MLIKLCNVQPVSNVNLQIAFLTQTTIMKKLLDLQSKNNHPTTAQIDLIDDTRKDFSHKEFSSESVGSWLQL